MVSSNENLNLGTDVAENISPFTLRRWFAFPYHIYKGLKIFQQESSNNWWIAKSLQILQVSKHAIMFWVLVSMGT